MRGSRCAAQHPHSWCAGTAVCGSRQDERAPASQTGLSGLGECDASSLRGQRTGTPHRSQMTGEVGAGWGGSGGRFPLQSGYGSASGSGNGASPAPGPQPDLLEGNSGHRCDRGSSLSLGRHSPQACSGRGPLRHHRRNAGTCYG